MRAIHRPRPRRRIAALGSATAAAVLLLTPAAHATDTGHTLNAVRDASPAAAHRTTTAAHSAAGPLALGSAAIAGAAGVTGLALLRRRDHDEESAPPRLEDGRS